MVIYCSKTLQTAFELTKTDMVKPENLPQNDFYSWHGHVARVDGRNVIALMNDKTMYCMLFRNKLPRTASKFAELVKEAMRLFHFRPAISKMRFHRELPKQ